MLVAYQTALTNLTQAPSSPIPLIPVASQTTYINTARNQVAADAECIRAAATLSLSLNTRSYAFSTIVPIGTGLSSVMAVRSAQLVNGGPVYIIPWERFQAYYQPNGATGPVTLLAQQGQGTDGTLSTYLTPAGTAQLLLDVVCLPEALVDDSTPEAIPELFTDAVPFYGAWLAYQSMQRQADADKMLQRYQMLIRRGREMATSTELPDNMPGGPGATMAAARQTLGWPPQAPGR